jgi:hypothetical protein
MSVYLQGSSVLLDGSNIATSSDCCCGVTGACCVGTDCTIQTEEDCTGMGGTYQGNNTTCDPNPCGVCCTCFGTCLELSQDECDGIGGVFVSGSCPDACCQNTVSHVEATLRISGSSTFNCSGFEINTTFDCTYTFSGDFDPCDGTFGFSIGDSVTDCITCSGSSCSPGTKTHDVTLGIQINDDGITNTTPFALIFCTCGGIDSGYATTLGPAYRPTFSWPTWCGWNNAAGTYMDSDTVSWAVGCPSTIGSGSATWDVTITIT